MTQIGYPWLRIQIGEFNRPDHAKKDLELKGYVSQYEMLHHGIRHKNQDALKWLFKNGHADLAYFASAVTGDSRYATILYESRLMHLYMVYRAVLGYTDGPEWLKRDELAETWMEFVEAIKNMLSND